MLTPLWLHFKEHIDSRTLENQNQELAEGLEDYQDKDETKRIGSLIAQLKAFDCAFDFVLFYCENVLWRNFYPR